MNKKLFDLGQALGRLDLIDSASWNLRLSIKSEELAIIEGKKSNISDDDARKIKEVLTETQHTLHRLAEGLGIDLHTI